MDQVILKKYAELIIQTGINIQKGQTLVISTPVECAPFIRYVVEAAYLCGAREVVLNWRDEQITKMKYVHAPDDLFDEFPDWQKEFYLTHSRNGAAFLSISASDPELMKDVDHSRMVRAQRASHKAIKEYADRMMANKNVWCVAAAPTVGWARKVFPGVSDEQAVEMLWEAIIMAVRADHENPVDSWKLHVQNLKKNMNFLNESRFSKLRFKNSLGTDLEVELPEKHLWAGGSEHTPEGIEFNANIPTEEVFTMPKRTGVNGVVYSSKPLNHGGNLIDEFSLTFKDGRIVDYTAKVGYDALKSLVETDEGSHYLGEVALVPHQSPISQSGILFYNTLFDENASCHLAIGRAYPINLTGGDTMSDDELNANGANDSIVHVDFMFGTKDLEITGITTDGKEVPVFQQGNFAF